MRHFGRERQSSIFDDIVCLSHPLFSWVPSPLNQHSTGITSNVKCIFHGAICEILFTWVNSAFYRHSLWTHHFSTQNICFVTKQSQWNFVDARERKTDQCSVYGSISPVRSERVQKGRPWHWVMSTKSERPRIRGRGPWPRAWRVMTGIWPRRSAVHPPIHDSCSL